VGGATAQRTKTIKLTHPVFDAKTVDPGKFARIIGHKGVAHSKRVCGDE
jgi:hypothetical protein